MEKYHHPGYEAQRQKKEEKRFAIFYEKKKKQYDVLRPPNPKDKVLTIHDLELYNEKFIQPLVDRIQTLEEELCRLEKLLLSRKYDGI
jgi:hypothetical protein